MFIEAFRSKSDFIVPIDSPTIEGIIAEILWIFEFNENAFVVQLREVEQAHIAVTEDELQQIAGNILGAGNM